MTPGGAVDVELHDAFAHFAAAEGKEEGEGARRGRGGGEGPRLLGVAADQQGNGAAGSAAGQHYAPGLAQAQAILGRTGLRPGQGGSFNFALAVGLPVDDADSTHLLHEEVDRGPDDAATAALPAEE